MRGVIQIGAHYAEEYEGWLSMGVKNFIFFEPIAANYQKLIRLLPKNDSIKTFNTALGNFTGEVEMFTETVHQGKSCSILKPKLHLEQYPDIEFDGVEVVKIDTLDTIRYDRRLYDYIHMDAQGYELEILKGAVDSLQYIDTIMTEVYRAELYEGCPMLKDIDNFLQEVGFCRTDMFWRGNTWGDAKYERI